MRRVLLVALAVVLVAALALGVSTAMAAKPQNAGKDGTNDVIARSNGFPSGEHFNLNIHGKKEGFVCDSTPGGNSIFVDQYGNATIQYVTNRKSNVGNLTVLDPCAVNSGTAKVQLPYEADGYFVFGRILAKPNNGKNGTPSSIVLYPAVVNQACNDDTEDPEFGTWTSCDLALGLIVGPNLYTPDPGNETYVRFDPGVTQGKGKSKATDITRLFTYTGWLGNQTEFEYLDITLGNGNGELDPGDVPSDLSVWPGVWDFDTRPEDGVISLDEWLEYQASLGIGEYFVETWIFNIADLVLADQDLDNNGTKLLQLRFYPVDTTEFTPY